MPINDISSIFSQNTTAAKKKLEDIEANKPGQYHSNWNGTINSLMDKIVNQKDFSYDFNADPLYQQYKDQYTVLAYTTTPHMFSIEPSEGATSATIETTDRFGNRYTASVSW